MRSARNMEIEYLRAAAIVLTLVSHLPILLPFHEVFFTSLFAIYMPWTGVDLFFCISGYVVSKAYLDYFDNHRREGNFAVAAQAFWLRRLYRLLPTAWLWIAIPFVLSLTFNETGLFGSWYQNLRSFAAVATFSGNFANQFGGILGPNSVYWSLALEEQFYFLFPLFLLVVRSTRWRIGALLAFIAIQFPLDRNLFAPPPAGMLSSFRLDAMMWGILLCLFSRSALFRQFEPTILGQSRWWRFCVAIFLLYLLGAISGQLIAMPVAVGLIAMVALLLVWVASYDKGYLYCPPGCSRLLAWLGTRSYALYVIHICAYRASVELWYRITGVQPEATLTWVLLATAALIMFAAAELNYRFVETPLRRRGAELANRRLQKQTEDTPKRTEEDDVTMGGSTAVPAPAVVMKGAPRQVQGETV